MADMPDMSYVNQKLDDIKVKCDQLQADINNVSDLATFTSATFGAYYDLIAQVAALQVEIEKIPVCRDVIGIHTLPPAA